MEHRAVKEDGVDTIIIVWTVGKREVSRTGSPTLAAEAFFSAVGRVGTPYSAKKPS